MRRFLAALSWLVLVSATWAKGDIQDILDRARANVRHDEFVKKGQGVRVTGRATWLGRDTTWQLEFLPGGQFRTTYQTMLSGAPLVECRAWDGKRSLITDWSGGQRQVGLGELGEERFLMSVLTGSWLLRDGPFTAKLDKSDADAVVLRLERADLQIEAILTLDRTCLRPRQLGFGDGDSVLTYSFDGWTAAGPVPMPKAIIREDRRLKPQRDVLRLDAPVAVPGLAAADLVKPAGPPLQIRFDPKRPAKLVVKKARSGHLVVRPLINGKDVGWFVLDSGAGMLALSEKAAAAAGVKADGRFLLNDSLLRPVGRVSTFQLGPLHREGLVAAITEQPPFLMVGEQIAGICGYEVFDRTVVELDVTTPTVALYDPTAYRREGLAWQSLWVYYRSPCVEAEFEGQRKGLFLIDTGAVSPVCFWAPSVQYHKLLEGRKVRRRLVYRFGGLSLEKVGELEYFELGGHRFQGPTAEFSEAYGPPYAVGLVGLELLRTFTVVFDYRSARIAFVKQKE
jgi:hypothetical protein